MNHYSKWIFSSNCLLLLCFSLLQFNLNAQTADLIIQKTGPTSVKEGLSMSYTIKISNNGPTAVTNATFNDTFPAGVTNVTLRNCTAIGGAGCPTTAQYSITQISAFYNFKGTIPSLPVNSSITFIIDLNAPTFNNQSSFSNTATVKTPIGITDPDLTTNSSTWNTVIIDTIPVVVNPITKNVDLVVFNAVNDIKGYDCTNLPKSYKYTVRWINNGPIDVPNVTISDALLASRYVDANYTYTWKITDTVWTSSPGTNSYWYYPPLFYRPFVDTGAFTIVLFPPIGISTIQRFVPIFQKGDTITLTYTFTLYTPKNTGCGNSIAWDLDNVVSVGAAFYDYVNQWSIIDSIPANNTKTITSTRMTCTNPTLIKKVDIKVIKTVDDTKGYPMDSLPKSYNYTVKWINLGPIDVINMSVKDEMFAVKEIINGTGNTQYLYSWNITNVTWKHSSGTTITPGTFFPLSSTFGIAFDQSPNPRSEFLNSGSAGVPFFKRGDTITLTFTFTLNKLGITGCGRENLSWYLRNDGGFSLPECYEDTVRSNNIARVESGPFTAQNISCLKTDLKVIKTVDDTTGYSCEQLPKSYHYKVQWINGGLNTIDTIQIYDQLGISSQFTGTGNTIYNYKWNISDVILKTSSGTVPPIDTFSYISRNMDIPSCNPFFGCFFDFMLTTFRSEAVTLRPNDTITLSYTFTVQQPTITGCGRNISWDLINSAGINYIGHDFLIDTVTNNNSTLVRSGKFTATSTDLVISTSVNPAIINSGETMTMSNEFYNASGSVSNPAIWLDTLPATFNINVSSIRCTSITGSSPCGRITYDSVTRVLRQEITNMPANSGVKVTFSGIVNSLYTVTEYNKANAYYSCLDCVPATNFTQTNYQINGQCDSVFAGVDGDTAVFDNYRDTIFLFNLLKGKPQLGGTWTRTEGTGGTFNAALGIFIVSSTTTTSTFMYVLPGNAPCPADTSYVIVSIIPSPLPDTSKTNVPVKSTVKTCDFVPVDVANTTVSLCDSSTLFSSAHGSWSIDSITKCLVYTSTNIKGNDSICVNVCNKRSQICKETNIIITISGVPPIAVSDTTIKTTANTPVIIPVLANDTSKDNDVLQLCNPAIYIQPSHGTITVNQNGTITYTPANGYEGIDSFQYIICDADGSDTAWVRVTVSCNDNEMCCDIPNAFSPNNDGVNDVFIARCACPVEEFYLLIYDRWGNKIFESFDINIGWDGIYKNKRAQVEAYGYYMEYRPTCSSNKVIKKGNVTLVE